MSRDTKLSILAGVLFVAGCLIAGLIIVSGVLASMPGADMLMAIALLALVPATLGLIAFLALIEKSSRAQDAQHETAIVEVVTR